MKTENLFINRQNPEVKLTSYLHDASPELQNARQRPAVLVLPGGGYYGCSDREAEPIALAYMAEGYNCFILRYSTGADKPFPMALNDAEEALSLIHENAGEWGIDKDRVAVIGFSAGGHLAACLSTMGKIRPNASILGYPCILEEISNILASPMPGLDDKVDKSTPPAFIFSTAADELVPVENSLAYAGALSRAGVPFEMHIFQNGVHGLSLAKPHTSSGFAKMVDSRFSQWFSLSVDWLKDVFGDYPADKEQVFDGALTEFDEYSVDVALYRLFENEECRALIISYFPAFADEKAARAAMSMSLRGLMPHMEDMLSEALLEEIDNKLKKISVS